MGWMLQDKRKRASFDSSQQGPRIWHLYWMKKMEIFPVASCHFDESPRTHIFTKKSKAQVTGIATKYLESLLPSFIHLFI